MNVEGGPKVSVCVITYNHGRYIRDCLESVVGQTLDCDLEVLVGDDCSTDGTTQIVREFAESFPGLVKPIFHATNVGATNNYLSVHHAAVGEYIAVLDGDDLMLPGKLQKQVEFLDRHPECSMVGHDMRALDDDTGAILAEHMRYINVAIPEAADVEFLVAHLCYFAHSSKMYRRSADTRRARSRPTVDFFFHIEHASRGRIGYINEVLGEWRKHAGSVTSASLVSPDVLTGYGDAFERALELGVAPAVVRQGRLRFEYARAFQALRAGSDREFRKCIRLQSDDYPYATWKHRLLHHLRGYTRIALAILRLNAAFSRGVR